MLEGVMRSPLRFLKTTPTGRLLNRFSSDIQQLDQDLASRGFRFQNSTRASSTKSAGVPSPLAHASSLWCRFLVFGARRTSVSPRYPRKRSPRFHYALTDVFAPERLPARLVHATCFQTRIRHPRENGRCGRALFQYRAQTLGNVFLALDATLADWLDPAYLFIRHHRITSRDRCFRKFPPRR